ncbi:MAG: response regulator transcription factor [Myxococcota bacterium]
MRTLVIEDDPKIASFIRRGLEAESHHVDVASDGKEGLAQALRVPYDLVLLDRMLPGMDGLDVLRDLREAKPTLPVIVVTARGEVPDRVEGLDLGADDYLTKPFSFVELMARIRALFRRSSAGFERVLEVGGFRLDRLDRSVAYGDGRVELSAREAQLLEFFLLNAGHPLTRAMIADRVWSHQFDTGTNVIDVYVNYLRKRLRELGVDPIRTIRGVGYLFELDAETP